MKKSFIAVILIIAFVFNAFASSVGTNSVGTSTKSTYSIEDFKKEVHLVRNPVTRNEKIVNGNGDILLKTLNPETESLSLIKDGITNEINFICKVFMGESIKENTYTMQDTKETFTDRYPSYRTEFYDKNGQEIGLNIKDCYGANMSVNKYIVYYLNDNQGASPNNARIYNTVTKETITPVHRIIDCFGGKPLISADTWGPEDNPKEILICDNDFKPVETIKDYTFAGKATINGRTYGRLCRKHEDNPKEVYYNYIDEDYNMIFKPDINTHIYDESNSVVTVQRDGLEFNYDFDTRQVIGDYKKKEKEKDYEAFNKYHEASVSIIQKANPKYNYVNVFVDKKNGKTLYFAYYEKEKNGKKLYNASDIYNEQLEKKLETDSVDAIYQEQALFYVDDSKLYDFDCNLVKTFENTKLDRYDKNKKYYFSDGTDSKLNKKEKFNLYDEKFNIVKASISNVDFYSLKNYIMIEDDESTKLYDENLNLKKDLGMKASIYMKSNDNKYLSFFDNTTKRMGVMDKDFNVLVKGLKKVDYLDDNYFTFQNGFKYGLMDYNGNVLVSYSIFDTMSEDAIVRNENLEAEAEM